jgi:tetratricopeptide (TPR) repeat protein
MKCLIVGSCLVLTLTTLTFAQRRGPSRGSAPMALPPGVNTSSTGTIFLSGKVVLDDGTELTEPAAIQTVCRGQKHTEAYSDSRGSFSFEIGRSSGTSAAGLADADTSWSNAAATRSRNLQDCELQASLSGFTSNSIALGSKIAMAESNDIGRIVLHRVAKVDGLTISATSAAAPGPAKKAFEKGRKEEEKNHWDQAQQAFEKAVQLYPKYAVAWWELGRIQQQKNDPTAARRSFNQSIEADPQYVNPYRGLAQLSAFTKQWKDVIQVTARLLDLNPVNFPDAWFLNALGNYYENNLEDAEKSARRGIHLDGDHQVPRLELLLGAVLAQRHKYSDAADHLRQYLHLVPTGPDSDLARKELADVSQSDRAQTPPAIADVK